MRAVFCKAVKIWGLFGMWFARVVVGLVSAIKGGQATFWFFGWMVGFGLFLPV